MSDVLDEALDFLGLTGYPPEYFVIRDTMLEEKSPFNLGDWDSDISKIEDL